MSHAKKSYASATAAFKVMANREKGRGGEKQRTGVSDQRRKDLSSTPREIQKEKTTLKVD